MRFYLSWQYNNINFKIPGTLNLIQNYSIWDENKVSNIYPILSISEYKNKKCNARFKFLLFDVENFNELPFDTIKNDSSLILISNTKHKKSKSFQFNFYENVLKRISKILLLYHYLMIKKLVISSLKLIHR